MTVMVDANFSQAQVLPLPYSPAVIRRMHTWQNELPHILVPGLWEYEVVTGLQRACSLKLYILEQVQTSLNELVGIRLRVVLASPHST